MSTERVDKHLQQKLKSPYFRELYELESQKNQILKKIIEYRVKHKLSQGQLAKKAGVTQQHISKIESGEFSNIVTLEKILLFIGYTIRFEAVPLSRKVAAEMDQEAYNKKGNSVSHEGSLRATEEQASYGSKRKKR